MSNYNEYMKYFMETVKLLQNDPQYEEKYNDIVDILSKIRSTGGRIFVIGMGGSAANASHMTNDFRKIGGLDTICLSDNIAELTARANDDGLDTIYSNSMKVSKFNWKDILFVLSVSGGNKEKKASMALVEACQYARQCGGYIFGIVGMKDSETERRGDRVIVTPEPAKYVTQIAESLQPVIWHGMVSDERLMKNKAKW